MELRNSTGNEQPPFASNSSSVSLEEAIRLMSSYGENDRAVKLSALSEVMGRSESQIAYDLSCVRSTPQSKRLVVDRGGLISAAIALALFFTMSIGRHVFDLQHRLPTTKSLPAPINPPLD